MAPCSGGPINTQKVSTMTNLRISQLKKTQKTHKQKSTKQALAVFRDYFREKSLPIEFETFDKQSLANILGKFHVEARNANGECYKTAILKLMRFLQD